MVLAYWWLRASVAARESVAAGGVPGCQAGTARFYFARILPRTLAHAESMRAGQADDGLDAESFGS